MAAGTEETETQQRFWYQLPFKMHQEEKLHLNFPGKTDPAVEMMGHAVAITWNAILHFCVVSSIIWERAERELQLKGIREAVGRNTLDRRREKR